MSMNGPGIYVQSYRSPIHDSLVFVIKVVATDGTVLMHGDVKSREDAEEEIHKHIHEWWQWAYDNKDPRFAEAISLSAAKRHIPLPNFERPDTPAGRLAKLYGAMTLREAMELPLDHPKRLNVQGHVPGISSMLPLLASRSDESIPFSLVYVRLGDVRALSAGHTRSDSPLTLISKEWTNVVTGDNGDVYTPCSVYAFARYIANAKGFVETYGHIKRKHVIASSADLPFEEARGAEVPDDLVAKILREMGGR